jgi:hypothetical protein
MNSDYKVNTINWFFGRGLSIECNLSWTVPKTWTYPYPCISRDFKISMIKFALEKEMNKSSVDCQIINDFLDTLSSNTKDNFNHRFITTNWDYLLQSEILNRGFKIKPSWLDDSHVFHLNGTIENLENNTNRSPFLLEEDLATERTPSCEANKIYNNLIWNKLFIVVGMSFECDTDRFFLNALHKVEDDLLIGKSIWIIINPNEDALNKSSQRIQDALPSAKIRKINKSFKQWVNYDLINFMKKIQSE